MSDEPVLIIFDCDGTILDSQWMIINAMHTAFRANRLPLPGADDVRNIIGLSLPDAVCNLANHLDTTELKELEEAYKAAFIEQRQHSDFHEPMFEGAREAIEHLSARENVLLSVATGKSRRGLDVFLTREEISHHFIFTQTADDAPSKPHPGMIENVIRDTGIERSNVLMVGDTSYDIEMARNAGVGALGVSWGYHPRASLIEAGAHHLLDSFDEFHAIEALFEKCNPENIG